MQCNTIFGLELDSKSIEALEDIKRRTNMTAILSKLLPFGVLTNIFLGNGYLNQHSIYRKLILSHFRSLLRLCRVFKEESLGKLQ